MCVCDVSVVKTAVTSKPFMLCQDSDLLSVDFASTFFSSVVDDVDSTVTLIKVISFGEFIINSNVPLLLPLPRSHRRVLPPRPVQLRVLLNY